METSIKKYRLISNNLYFDYVQAIKEIGSFYGKSKSDSLNILRNVKTNRYSNLTDEELKLFASIGLRFELCEETNRTITVNVMGVDTEFTELEYEELLDKANRMISKNSRELNELIAIYMHANPRIISPTC